MGANYREAHRGRSKPEFIAKCGDSLREIEESAYWLELLVESGIVSADKLQPLRGRMRRTDRDLRHDHQAGSQFRLSLHPSSFILLTFRPIRGIDFNFGKEPANSFTSGQHPDLRADFVMANPPFNISEWWDAKLEGDPRWRYGTPPRGNANFAWIQHMLHHLAPERTMALLPPMAP